MKKRVSFFLLCIICFSVYSQNKKASIPEFIGLDFKSIENNTKWEILKKASGNLNKDSINDTALILEKRCTNCKTLKNKPRVILILINDKVSIQNNKFIARGDEGGMLPYLEPELSIENHLLIIHYQFTRSNQSYTFEFKEKGMVLLSAESNSVHSATGNIESNKFDFNKGVLITITGNISKEENKTEKINISKTPKHLSEFGEMSDWEVVKNKYL